MKGEGNESTLTTVTSDIQAMVENIEQLAGKMTQFFSRTPISHSVVSPGY